MIYLIIALVLTTSLSIYLFIMLLGNSKLCNVLEKRYGTALVDRDRYKDIVDKYIDKTHVILVADTFSNANILGGILGIPVQRRFPIEVMKNYRGIEASTIITYNINHRKYRIIENLMPIIQQSNGCILDAKYLKLEDPND